jgi:hypothetical protein
MKKKIALKDALDAWAAGPPAGAGDHVPPAELYEFLSRLAPPAPALLEHLTRCPWCAREMRQMAENLPRAETHLAGWDLALPKAAATDTASVWRVPTEAGKYTIEFHPHSSDKTRGLITLQVAPQYRSQLEGHRVALRDSKGRLLLEGRIVNGEAAQELRDLDRIEAGFIVHTD